MDTTPEHTYDPTAAKNNLGAPLVLLGAIVGWAAGFGGLESDTVAKLVAAAMVGGPIILAGVVLYATSKIIAAIHRRA